MSPNDVYIYLFFVITGGPGLIDPCEKKPIDTLTPMGEQQREDITSSAQVQTTNEHIHKVKPLRHEEIIC